jgi:phosphatidyl-myo-inositol alpha-mannosyltransferase
MTFGVLRLYLRLPPEPGGMEAHIGRISDEQRRMGRKVINVFNQGAGGPDTLQVLPRLNLQRFSPDALRKLIFYLAVLLKRGELKRRIAESGAEPFVMHVHGSWSDFLLGDLIARALGIGTLVGAVHGEITAAKASLFAYGLRRYAAVYVTGRRDLAHLETRLPGRTVHITSGHRACFLTDTAPKGRCEDILWAGSLVPVKNPRLALEVARRLPHRRLRLIGDGPLRAELEAVAAKLANVELVGALASEALAEAMREAGVLLSTSQAEGTPTVFFEAMASGLPIVTTPSNDFSWLIEAGVNGWIVDDHDAVALADRIEALLSDPPRARVIGQANRARASAFSWPAIAKRIDEMMTGAIAKGAR